MDNNNTPKSLKSRLMRKYYDSGLVSMSEIEILEFILSYSEKKDVCSVAENLLEYYGSINNISKTDPKILLQDEMMCEHSAVLFKLIAIMSREYNMDKDNISKIDCVDIAMHFLKNFYIGVSGEKVAVIALEKDFTIKDYSFISSGTNADVKLSCRDISKFALNNDTEMIIMAHNHPLGQSEPSDADIFTTKQIIKALENIGVIVLDHIIVGQNDCFSMRENFSDDIFKDVSDCGYIYNSKDIS